MNNQKNSREQFEDAWVEDNSSTPEEAEVRRSALKRIWHASENGEGAYFDSFVMMAWVWWKKSRDSLVIELPDYMHPGEYQSAGYNNAIDDCERIISSIGITVKE